MSLLEIFLIAVGLCFDTLAISLIGGACMKDVSLAKRLKVLFFFAFFQGGLTFLGWALGSTVNQYIEKYDHWVAFLLLAWIGGNMIVESFKKGEEQESVDLLNTGKLVLSSVATSIDAFAVGISFAMIQMKLSAILEATLVIALVTAAAAEVGLRGGKKLGELIGSKCDLLGGLILIGIGVKILIEHLM